MKKDREKQMGIPRRGLYNKSDGGTKAPASKRKNNPKGREESERGSPRVASDRGSKRKK